MIDRDHRQRPWEEALVMMVDDEALLTDVIQTHLEDAGYQHFIACNDPTRALDLIRDQRPDIVLLDLMMPGLSGFDILATMRRDPALAFLPVIVLTAASEPDTKLQALEMGATEFLSKPVDASELILRVRNTLAFKQYQDRLAYTDPVTGLANRARFTRRLEDRLGGGQALALLHLACDQFRQTRETLGSRAADALLREAAQRLRVLLATHSDAEPPLPDQDMANLARIGDQDFALLLHPLEQADDAAQLAERALSVLGQPIEVDGHQIVLTPGVGIAIGPTDAAHPDALLKSADIACAKARRADSKVRCEFFSQELTARSIEQLRIARELRLALERNELRLHYQPKVCLRSGRITGAEALVRWQHPDEGLLLPGRFIGVAEAVGLMGELSAWVMRTACLQIALWHAAGLPPLKISINVAKPQFEDERLAQHVAELLDDSGAPASWLMVELTESMLVDDAARAMTQMHDLRALGVGLSIDDFGTGYSSLSYLKRFPANELKIDRSFITDLPRDPKDRAIVQTVITLGHSLGMGVVAEGIETAEQHRALQELGCDTFQGFLFSRAIPPEDFTRLVATSPEPAAATRAPSVTFVTQPSVLPIARR